MVDAFAEFALFAHQHSVASSQFLQAQAMVCMKPIWVETAVRPMQGVRQ
jgi:hypothetical protein